MKICGVRKILRPVRIATARVVAKAPAGLVGAWIVGAGIVMAVIGSSPRERRSVVCRCGLDAVLGPSPVRLRNTSSRVGRRRPTSSTSMPASSRMRMALRSCAVPGRHRDRDLARSRPRSGRASSLNDFRQPRDVVDALRVGVDLDDVVAAGRLQLERRAGRDDPAVVDDHDVVRELVGLVEVLRREHDVGAGGDELADGVPQLDAAARIEPGGGLVEQQQLRGADQAGSEVELAAHAARVGADTDGRPPRSSPSCSSTAAAVRASRRRPLRPNSRADHLEVLATGHRRLDRRRTARPDRSCGGPRADRGSTSTPATRRVPASGSVRVATDADERGLARAVGAEHGDT